MLVDSKDTRRRPIGVDLFSGAGGMSLGFEQAGFDVVAAVEVDPVHAAVHEFNFPNSSILAKSVADVTGDDIRREAWLEHEPIDCVFGGAPCQGFSMIGKRALEDPRNALVREFVRLVDELDPRTFVFENVKGLTVGKHKAFVDELIETFEARGFNVRLPYKVLNAANYGVPQSRERFFLIGARKGETLPEYPNPTTAFGKIDGGLPPAPTAKEAIGDLPDPESVGEVEGDVLTGAKLGRASNYARILRGLDNGAEDYSEPRSFNRRSGLSGSATTAHTDISRRRFSETEQGRVEPISRFFKLHPEKQCNTLRAGTDGSRGAFTSPRPIHYEHSRCVTVREMARLHGFPDWFRFHVTKWNGARQIGNAVPPPLARAIAHEVREALGADALKPLSPLKLGDPSLLSLTVKSAAAYFGVEAPDRRRTSKSGAKKRTQAEIERAVLFEQVAE